MWHLSLACRNFSQHTTWPPPCHLNQNLILLWCFTFFNVNMENRHKTVLLLSFLLMFRDVAIWRIFLFCLSTFHTGPFSYLNCFCNSFSFRCIYNGNFAKSWNLQKSCLLFNRCKKKLWVAWQEPFCLSNSKRNMSYLNNIFT